MNLKETKKYNELLKYFNEDNWKFSKVQLERLTDIWFEAFGRREEFNLYIVQYNLDPDESKLLYIVENSDFKEIKKEIFYRNILTGLSEKMFYMWDKENC